MKKILGALERRVIRWSCARRNAVGEQRQPGFESRENQ